jgi:small subunit ribosomal protein S16
MLKIRLQRTGRKHEPTFRVVVTESVRGPKSGRSIENVGFYDAKNGTKKIKGDRVLYWMGRGAQVSDTVHNFLVSTKVITGKKRAVFIPKPKEAPAPVTEETTKEEVAKEEAEEIKTPEALEPTVSQEE